MSQLTFLDPAAPARHERPNVPPTVDAVLQREDAALAISISGGKDSQAMLRAVVAEYVRRGWKCHIYAIHADLGRAEWPQTPAHVERIAHEAGVPLQVVRRPQGDLVQEIEERMAKLEARALTDVQHGALATMEAGAPESGDPGISGISGISGNPWPTSSMRYCTADQKRGQIDKAKRSDAPGWPDAANRYCTADQKRGPIQVALRADAPGWPDAANRYRTAHQKSHQLDGDARRYSLIVSAIGIRADESRARAKKLAALVDAGLTGKVYRDLTPEAALEAYQPGGKARLALTWHPILDWSVEDVWEVMGTSAADLERRQRAYRAGYTAEALEGWPAHEAYVYGNQRLSCVFCVLGSKNDLATGARHNPELYRHYVGLERRSGWAFQQGKPLTEVAPELLTGPAALEDGGAG